MNSSGIKRGLAAGAISALAVTGLPFLASSASAAVGDSITVASVGPTLNAGDLGGVVVLKTKGLTAGDEANIKAIGTDLKSSADNANQTVLVKDATFIADKSANDSNPNDGYDEVKLHVAVTTPHDGDTAHYALYVDDNNSNTVDANEARTTVDQSTSGKVAKIDVSPASQSAVQGVASDDYTVSLLDAADRPTQLLNADSITVAGDGDATPSDTSLSATDTELGTDTFTATGNTVGAHDITLVDTLTPTVKNKVTLNVTKAAVITADEVDIVTGADSWDGFGNGTDGGTTAVRVDQSSIRIDFKSTDVANDKNSTVILTVSSGNVTFGGEGSTKVSTKLDANGVGSVVITPDAGSIQAGDSITVSGNTFDQTLNFQRAAATAVEPSSDVYFSKLDGSVDVTATVLDQFGLPVTTGFLSAARNGANNDTAATTQKKPVGSDGSATFTFTDKDATAGDTDTVEFRYFADQYDNTGTDLGGDATIKYTVDGMGSDYKISLADTDTEAKDYDASDVTVVPLADTVADSGDEAADLDVDSTEPGAEMSVSVDNGALILEPGESKLSEGSSSVTAAAGDFNTASGYQIVGTKSGVVTVTVESAHRTETAQMTVGDETDQDSARNVTVSGPAEVENGATQIAYTAVITDAFGNPVPNIPVQQLNIQVSGPAQFQDSDVMTNAAGQINLNVKVDSGAEGDVTIKVTGLPDYWYNTQFGAAADRLHADSSTKDGEGLAASSNVATATTTVKAAPAPSGPSDIVAVLKGKSNGAKDDKLKVHTDKVAEGATVKLWKFNKNGKKVLVDEGTVNKWGNAKFVAADKNGNKVTKYIAKVLGTDANKAAKTNTKKVR
ncbi:hypothetical protein GCM10009844_42820 [Nocardioides koreensis]|uniref:Big-1 domain-containing protein n=1 Tax=Nocardioides koreensis TaxID=433651 RepID=A0ABN3A7F9_9ACTN